MPTLAPAPLLGTMSAEDVAESNWRANRDALIQTESAFATLLQEIEPEHQFIYARDGSITAMLSNGRWWKDCSVPLLASRALLKSLDEGAVGSCLLDPTSAGMVRAARERMGPLAALFVVQPDLQIMRMILNCHDFSDPIMAHRIWFITGSDWSSQFRELLKENSGLATPTRFIRTKLSADDVINPMIAAAQAVFSDILSSRGEMIAAIKTRSSGQVASENILHVGGTAFRLWDFGTSVLQEQLSTRTVKQFDTDDALFTSPVALLTAAQNCPSVVAANLCRADSNQLLNAEMPWISWITQPNVPLFETAGARDGLVLADAGWKELARKAGWPEDRLRICGWPSLGMDSAFTESQPVLGLICDTQKIQIPPAVKDFSSHRLLWDLIEEELAMDPLVVEDIDAYLTDRAQQLSIKADALDLRAFIESLILPAYQQGLARRLVAADIPVSILGRGWTELPAFIGQTRGELSDRKAFNTAVAQCSGLIYCWPVRAAHAIDALGKPVVHRSGRDWPQFIRNAKRVLSGSERRPPATHTANVSLQETILELLR